MKAILEGIAWAALFTVRIRSHLPEERLVYPIVESRCTRDLRWGFEASECTAVGMSV